MNYFTNFFFFKTGSLFRVLIYVYYLELVDFVD